MLDCEERWDGSGEARELCVSSSALTLLTTAGAAACWLLARSRLVAEFGLLAV